MIRIRYSSLREGLHAQARRESGHTVIYLRPGLSSEQRREALRRVRQTARMGHGPRLPAAGLSLALAADRTAATTRNAAAAVRQHPLGASTLAALAAGAVISYSLFVTVSVRIIYPQSQAAPPVLAHPASPAPNPDGSSPARHSRTPSPGGTPVAGSTAAVVSAPSPGGSRGSGTSGGSATPGGSQPTPAPRPSSPAPSPSLLPSPSPAGSGGGGTLGVCVKVGPLGTCLTL